MYKRVAAGIMRNLDVEKQFEAFLTPERLGDLVEKTLNDPEMQKMFFAFTDDLYDRYTAKITSSIGGSMKGVNATLENQNPLGFLSKGGKMNWMQIIMGIMLRGKTEGQEGSQNRIP